MHKKNKQKNSKKETVSVSGESGGRVRGDKEKRGAAAEHSG